MSRALAATIALSACLTAQTTVTTVLSNGQTDKVYDMVILGDGYQASEQSQFNSDVNTFLAALFATQPYQTFSAYYNVHTVFRPSIDSGADHPDANPPIWRNTAYDASYNTGGTGRCLYIGNTSQALADAALAPANEGRILVLVNDSRYGGCAGTFAVSYNGSSMSQVQIHELGHSLGQLADEYDYPNNTYTGSEPNSVNITTSPSGQKWSYWHGTGGISAFEGAGYYLYGLYRPRSNCLMRSLGAPLCAVCQENIVRITNSICNAISQQSPTTTSFTLNRGTVQPFSFSHYVPPGNMPTIEWKLDGNVVPGQTTTSFSLDTSAMSLGIHTVECRVQDNTSIVRQDPSETMVHDHTWTVTITDPTLAQLQVSYFQTNPLWVSAGNNATLNTTIYNAGPATAGTFDVEFFMALTQGWTPNDIYLGKQTVTSLPAGQQVALAHPVSLPWTMQPSVYYVYAVADRTNAVPELNENDNERLTVFVGQPGPCFTKIEFDDPLLHPRDATSLSVTTGGDVHPTVVAPCATPGSLYLIAWGCSGTTPGTTLAPGVTVPINQDFCTQLGLAAANGAWFQAFLGTLDAEGMGRATFALPPNSGLWASNGHFAAVLIDPQTGFAGATNAIAITLTP